MLLFSLDFLYILFMTDCSVWSYNNNILIRLYNIQTTKEKKCYKGSLGDEGVLLRIHLDPSGTYVATTCTDKNVCILDFHTGELVATMYGHSEVITGVKFVNDLKHVITVSADG